MPSAVVDACAGVPGWLCGTAGVAGGNPLRRSERQRASDVSSCLIFSSMRVFAGASRQKRAALAATALGGGGAAAAEGRSPEGTARGGNAPPPPNPAKRGTAPA